MRYKIGHRSLRRVCPNLSDRQAKQLAVSLGTAMHRYGIKTKREAAMFIAQLAHESNGFRTSEEYADGSAYEGRKDLGNTRKGDGKKFKGRGRIMITGRNNYKQLSGRLNRDFVKAPWLLAKQPYSELASAIWWKDHNCGYWSKKIDDPEARLLKVTKIINGGYNGLYDRRIYHNRARKVAFFLKPRRVF